MFISVKNTRNYSWGIWYSENKMRYDFSDNQEEILQGLTCPVLIIHGKKDDRVPVGDSQKAITFLSGESRLVILDGATHFFRTNNKTIIAVTKNWFEKYLRAG